MRAARTSESQRGFTLIEMLIVIIIVAVLVALIAGVGVAVFRGREEALTRNVLMSMDRALQEYIDANSNSLPPFSIDAFDRVPGEGHRINGGLDSMGNRPYFVAFPTGGQRYPVRPDASVFIKQARGTGEADAIVAGLGERFLRLTISSPTGDAVERDATPSVVDAWASDDWPDADDGEHFPIELQQVIYYIHPDNRLAQELYGRCINRRPYFMSAGRDRLYGLRRELGASAAKEQVEASLDDNIYSYPVGDANRTTEFFDTYR